MPGYERRGCATAVMKRVATEVAGFELGALSPATPEFYERLGWKHWRGPLTIRTDDGLMATPNDTAMVLRLPMTPKLDLDAPMSAEWRPGEPW